METKCGTNKRQKKKRIGWLLTGLTAALMLSSCAFGNGVQPMSKPVFARAQVVGEAEKDNGDVYSEIAHREKILAVLGSNKKKTVLEKIILLSR